MIKQLQPVSYNMKRADHAGIGFIAQDVRRYAESRG
ncbi:MAG: tail fiber domain-containing protein [Clostridium sp.]